MEDSHNLNRGSSDKKSNVVVFEPKKRDMTPSQKFHSLTTLNKLMPHVSPAEFTVLYFVWMRTIYWSKTTEYVCRRHFLEGIPGTIEPLNMSTRNLVRCLKNLVAGRMLFRTVHRDGGSSFTINFAWEPEMLKQPKKAKTKNVSALREPKKSTKTGGANLALGGCKFGTHKYDNNKSVHKDNGKPLSVCNSAAENLIKQTKEAIERSREQKAKKLILAAKRESVPDLEKLWREAMRIAHPDFAVPVWGPKERGQVKNMRNDFQQSGEPFFPFLNFCIENWNRILAFRFAWMKEVIPPEFPDICFLAGYKKQFLFAYGDASFWDRSLGLTRHEREMRKYKKMGYTEEQAVKAIEHDMKHNQIIQKEMDRAEQLESGVRGLTKKVKQLEHEKAMLEIQRGRELMKQRKQKKAEPEPVKQKLPVDADGWAEFKGFEAFGGFDD